MVARLADAGLCGCAPEAAAQVRASLASLACCAAVFVGFGGAMWSQLTIGWQWSEPDTAGTVATFVMSGAMLVFAVLALLAALPVAWSVVSRMARGGPRGSSARRRSSWPAWRSWSSAAGISGTAGRAPGVTRGPARAWCPAG